MSLTIIFFRTIKHISTMISIRKYIINICMHTYIYIIYAYIFIIWIINIILPVNMIYTCIVYICMHSGSINLGYLQELLDKINDLHLQALTICCLMWTNYSTSNVKYLSEFLINKSHKSKDEMYCSVLKLFPC